MAVERPDLLVTAAPRLHADLVRLCHARLVFFAGLPGTGKSLLLHQLAHLAHAAGRVVHLLQWDVVRPAFEASAAGRRYPAADGVTHAMVRKAAGLWARAAVTAWNERHPEPAHLLLGETPFVGNRFVELARAADDGAEPLLAAPTSRFAIAVPSRAVRAVLVAERERRAARPLHPRESEDAPPAVLRALWQELVEVAVRDGLVPRADPVYDPDLYRSVYERVLRHRHVDVLAVDVLLPTGCFSPYAFAVPRTDLVPAPDEIAHAFHAAERRYVRPGSLDREVAGWWAG